MRLNSTPEAESMELFIYVCMFLIQEGKTAAELCREAETTQRNTNSPGAESMGLFISVCMFVIQEGKTAAALSREAGYDSLAEYLEGSVSKVIGRRCSETYSL